MGKGRVSPAKGRIMFWFLVPLIIGLALAGASAFTAAFSRRWGAAGGRIATFVLRNLLGIPLWVFGFILAWIAPAGWVLDPGRITAALGLLLIITGAIPVIWGHIELGLRTHMPSIKDTLVSSGMYAYVRHPIYAGGILVLAGLFLLKPSLTVLIASAVVIAWALIQARLEEIDLMERMPDYKVYMERVPRFIPRLRRRVKP